MALLAVELDKAVLEITPHLEHFRSSRLRASAGTLKDMFTQTHTHTHILAAMWEGSGVGNVWKHKFQ